MKITLFITISCSKALIWIKIHQEYETLYEQKGHKYKYKSQNPLRLTSLDGVAAVVSKNNFLTKFISRIPNKFML